MALRREADGSYSFVCTFADINRVRRYVPEPDFTFELVKHARTGAVRVLLTTDLVGGPTREGVIGLSRAAVAPGPGWAERIGPIDQSWDSPDVAWARVQPWILLASMPAEHLTETAAGNGR